MNRFWALIKLIIIGIGGGIVMLSLWAILTIFGVEQYW